MNEEIAREEREFRRARVEQMVASLISGAAGCEDMPAGIVSWAEALLAEIDKRYPP